MTEYEYADLFAAFLEAQNSVAANYMTLVSAMLAASYFFAPKLDRLSASMFLFIYSLWAVTLIMAVFGAVGDFGGIGKEIARLGQMPDTQLGWLGPAATNAAGMDFIFLTAISGSILVYIASGVFFFQMRRKRFD